MNNNTINENQIIKEGSVMNTNAIVEDILTKNNTRLEKINEKTVELEKLQEESCRDFVGELTEKFAIEGRLKTDRQKAENKATARIEEAIRLGQDFEKSMQDLIEDLIKEISDLGIKINQLNEYQGIEKLFNIFGTHRMANQKRIKRIQNQNVSDSLRIITDYGSLIAESKRASALLALNW